MNVSLSYENDCYQCFVLVELIDECVLNEHVSRRQCLVYYLGLSSTKTWHFSIRLQDKSPKAGGDIYELAQLHFLIPNVHFYSNFLYREDIQLLR